MRQLVATVFPVLVLSALIGSGRATAGIILVPGPYNGATQIHQVMPMGETFTAIDPIIQSIGFSVRDFTPTAAPNQDMSLTITLYTDGLATPLASGAVNLLPGFDGLVYTTFTPPGTPLLTVGKTYTAIISAPTSRWGVETADTPDAYPDGAPVFNGVVNPSAADLSLRVVGTEAVPLPSALNMGATVVIGILLLTRPLRRLLART